MIVVIIVVVLKTKTQKLTNVTVCVSAGLYFFIHRTGVCHFSGKTIEQRKLLPFRLFFFWCGNVMTLRGANFI